MFGEYEAMHLTDLKIWEGAIPGEHWIIHFTEDCKIYRSRVSDLAFSGGNVFVANTTQESHGYQMPELGILPMYTDTADGFLKKARADDSATIAQTFVIQIPNDDTLVTQSAGIVHFDGGHGLQVGQSYYLDQDNLGGVVLTPPSSGVVQELFFVQDTENIVLKDLSYNTV